MGESLIPYLGSLPETREESISRQFYLWEQRGRGWQAYQYPVELEPPLRPFYYYEPTNEPVRDDGRVHTFFSRLFSTDGGDKGPENLSAKNASLARFQEYLAEADEPEYCTYSQDDFSEIQLAPTKNATITKAACDQLVSSLAYCANPVSFEVVGTTDSITYQYAATEPDLPQLRQQLKASFHDTFRQKDIDSSDFLSSAWLAGSGSEVVIDFGLSEEFFLPLEAVSRFDTDPLSTAVGAMSDLGDGETAVLQILFQKVRRDWAGETARTLALFSDTEFFDHLPGLSSLVRQKFSSALFAVVVRIAASSENYKRSMGVIRNVAGSLAQLARPAGNEMIPLSNDDYDSLYHEQALLNRQSFRPGMLLNLDELVSLVHPPSQAVRSEKLLCATETTKRAPDVALGNGFSLGLNLHQEERNLVTLSAQQRTKHTHIIGSSGSGKSTLLLNLISQDLRAGHGLCVIDPHGDLIDEVIHNVPDDRMDDVILFDPSDVEFPIGFNILQASSQIEKTVLSSDLVATFRRMSTSWGDVMDAVLANAILAFVESSRGGTLVELKRFLVEKDFRKEFLDSVTDHGVAYFWEYEFPLIASKPQSSILIRLDAFLRQSLIRNIVSQKENKLDFRRIMDRGKILLIKLAQGLIGEESAYLLGTMLVSRIYQSALGRQDSTTRPYFWLYMDEFHHFVTPSMENILSGTRKYNLGLTLAHQEFRQLQSRSQEVANSILSNCYTRVCFRLGDTDADRFAAGFSFFDAKALQNLGVGEAIARVERADYDFNLTVDPVAPTSREEAERRRQAVRECSRALYGRPRRDVENELAIVREDAGAKLRAPVPKPETSAVRRELLSGQSETPPVNEHRYLQNLIKRIGEDHGFIATIEKEVFGGIGRIDVSLESDTRKIACEIAVTNTTEYEAQNIQKCLSSGFDRLVVISPDGRRLKNIRARAELVLSPVSLSKVHFLEPENFHLFLESLAAGSDTEQSPDKVKGYIVKTSVEDMSADEVAVKRNIVTDILSRVIRRRRADED